MIDRLRDRVAGVLERAADAVRAPDREEEQLPPWPEPAPEIPAWQLSTRVAAHAEVHAVGRYVKGPLEGRPWIRGSVALSPLPPNEVELFGKGVDSMFEMMVDAVREARPGFAMILFRGEPAFRNLSGLTRIEVDEIVVVDTHDQAGSDSP